MENPLLDQIHHKRRIRQLFYVTVFAVLAVSLTHIVVKGILPMF
jgi:hypothetical protein